MSLPSRLNSIKYTIGILFLFMSCIYFVLSLNGLSFGAGYALVFYGSKILPVTFMGLYLIRTTTQSVYNYVLKFSSFVIFFSSLVVALLFLINDFFVKTPMSFYFQSYNWYYPPAIEWALAFALSWLISYYVTKDSFFSTLFGIQVIVFGGTLYELPTGNTLFNNGIYFSPYYPFYIATSWICLIFIIYLLFEHKWHFTKLFWALIAFYIGYAIFYSFNPYFNIWLPRFPTILLLATLPLGFTSLPIKGDSSKT